MKTMKFLRAALIVAISIIPITSYAQTLGTTTRIPEGTCGTGGTAVDVLCANAGDHNLTIQNNNGAQIGIGQTFYLTTDFTNATRNFSTVTGLSFPVSASRNYHAICRITWQGSIGTAGPAYQWTGPGNFTALVSSIISPVNFTNFTTASATTFASTLANTNVITPTTNFTDVLEFAIIGNAAMSGTVTLTAAANGAGTLTIKAGSNCLVQ